MPDMLYHENNDIEFTPESMDVMKEIIEKIIPECRLLANQHGLSFYCHKRLETSIVYADRSMTGTMLKGIIMHAIEYTQQGGVTIISYNNEWGNVCIDVKNTGGVNEQELNGIKKLAELNKSQLLIQTSDGKVNVFTIIFNL
jgi:signal transduction histidine kinase